LVRSFCKDVKILENMHPLLVEVDEIKAIAQVEDPILSETWCLINGAFNNQFVQTADIYGIERYEEMLKLKVSDTDTLETRRFRIMSRFQEQAPYTWRVLHTILDSLLGADKYVIDRDVATKTVTVGLELTVGRQFNVVLELLERITPQNMILNVELRYNPWELLKDKTWGEVKDITWGEVKEGVL
jgi:hypothetical protein